MKTPWSAARNLLFQQVHYHVCSTVKDGMKTRVAQGHFVLLEQSRKILKRASCCAIQHCALIQALTKEKIPVLINLSQLICVVTPDQNLLLCEDETPRKIPFSPSEETLDLCESKSAPNSAYCVLSCSCFLGTKDNYIKFCPSCRPKPVCCKKGCSSLRIHDWHFEVSPVKC